MCAITDKNSGFFKILDFNRLYTMARERVDGAKKKSKRKKSCHKRWKVTEVCVCVYKIFQVLKAYKVSMYWGDYDSSQFWIKTNSNSEHLAWVGNEFIKEATKKS